MTEGVASSANEATARHAVLYGRWAQGGVGLQLTGNVQVDRRNLERPGNVVIEGPQSESHRTALSAYAAAAKSGGGAVIMQISHAGRQTPKAVNETPSAPSAVQVNMPGGQFGMPRAMSEKEVRETIGKFANAASIAKETGFDGVQIHAAHGYLISQFLSPISNKRTDEWGGPLENRARFLIEILRSVRLATGEGFTVGVKLNSTDFQKGGFSHEDCLTVVDMLNAEGVDFLEVSGGTYEQPKMAGIEGFEPVFEEQVRESTRARESYFASYARSVKARAKMPILATGGFRTAAAMNGALEDGEADMIGLGRPLCGDPDTAAKLLSGEITEVDAWEKRLKLGPTKYLGPHSPINLLRGIVGWGMQGWFCLQIIRMADGLEPDQKHGVFSALRKYQAHEKACAEAYHADLEAA